jgi:hypothetical protein
VYYIYGIVDPTNNMVCYVGITSHTPQQRLAQHLRHVERDQFTAKGVLINGLLENGYMPTAITLQVVESEQQAQIAERWWIAQGQMIGWPLTNTMHYTRMPISRFGQVIDEQEGESIGIVDALALEGFTLYLPIGDRPLNDVEANAVRRMRELGASKNKILDVVYGGKTPKRFAWVSEALSEGGAA